MYNYEAMEDKHINFLPIDEHEPIPEIRPKKWRNFLIFSFIGFVVVAIWTGRMIWGNPSPNDPQAYDPVTLEPKKPEGFFKRVSNFVFTSKYELNGYDDDRINLLLFGIGGAGHDGPYLTDTIILVSIKPSTGQIALISIPRDLSAKIPGYGQSKINLAASQGLKKGESGPAFATEIISDMFDTEIHYYAQVDFEAFVEIVDYVGGVRVNVDRAFTDEMYPSYNNGYQTVSFANGIQTMNGETALSYVRSRHGNNGEGSDFARAKRQQKIIFALKEKILSASTLANPIRINKIIASLEKHIETDMQFADIMYFLKLARGLEIKQIITAVLDDSPNGFLKANFTESGAYVLEPKTGDWNVVIDYIKNIFEKGEIKIDDTPSQPNVPIEISEDDAKIEVQNGTWIPGLAARARKRLEDKGFIIASVGNSEVRPQPTGGIYNLTNKDLTGKLTDLQHELRLPIKKNLPVGVQASDTTDILVLLGEDTIE